MMTRRIMLSVLVVLCVLIVPVLAAGTATWTHAEPPTNNIQTDVYSIAWTSNASGAVSGNAYAVRPGRLVQVAFVPGSSGSQPTDLYDVTLVDVNAVDLLAGAGADRSNSAGSYLVANPPIFVTSNATLDLVVANAGNAKSGTVVLWVRRD